MTNLTEDAAALAMDWLNGVGTPIRPTTPLKLALTETVGDAATIGTELYGGAYARQDVTMAAGSPAASVGATSYVSMPACTIIGVEVWNSTGALRIWYAGLHGPSYSVTATDNVFTAAGHGLVDTTKVAFAPGQVPGGLAANTIYFIRDATTDTFKLAAIAGGTALDVNADGTGTMIVAVSVNVGDTVTVSSGDITMIFT